MHKCRHCSKEFAAKHSLNSHRCSAARSYKEAILVNNKSEIIDLFVNQYWSVIDIANKFELTHARVANFLKDNGVEYDRDVILKRRKYAVARSKKTFIAKYGVDNPSKCTDVRSKAQSTCIAKYGVTNGGWSIDSQIKHYIMGKGPHPEKLDNYRVYVEEVSKYTKENKNLVYYTGVCYYSGIEIHTNKHWNHPFRATLDHKIPVLIGFERGIPAKHIASVNNLVWCCRLLNNYKNTMTEEQFRSSGIIERLKDYESYLRSTSK